MQILKTWNIRLLESITFNPQQLNEISSVLNGNTLPAEGKKGRGRIGGSKSFRTKASSSSSNHEQDLHRANSFSKLQTHRTDLPGSGTPPMSGAGLSQGGIRVGGLPPLPREANTRSWGGIDDPSINGMLGNLSQDSFFTHSTGLIAPPLPPRPRPSHRLGNYSPDDDAEDPDYAYIKEDEVEGPPKKGANSKEKQQRPSNSVDDVLNELEQDIIRDNQVKKRRAQTLHATHTNPSRHQKVQKVAPPPLSLGPSITFPKTEPQDYTDFVPAKRSQLKSTSSEPDRTVVPVSHVRSVSEPDSRPIPSPSRLLSQPPLTESNEEMDSSASPFPAQQQPPFSADHTPSDYSECQPGSAPALPPRTWRHASTSSFTSSGSNTNFGSSTNFGGTNFGSSELSGNASGSVFTSERGVATGAGAGGVSPSSERLSDESAGTREKQVSPVSKKPASPDSKKPASPKESQIPVYSVVNKPSKITLSDKENKAPPTTIPEESAQPGADQEAREGLGTPPPLPPRSPTKDKLVRKSSTSSTSSVSSNGRCPRCRKSKTSVSKTFSLEPRGIHTSSAKVENCRKSMPDLADANPVPENSLEGKGHRYTHRHTHCSKCSPGSSCDTLHGSDSGHSLHSSSQPNFGYLQLVGEEQKDLNASSSSVDNELGAEMDLLNSCLQTLEYLEHKVNSASSSSMFSLGGSGGGTNTTTQSSVPSSSSPSSSPSFTTTSASSLSGYGQQQQQQQTSAPGSRVNKTAYTDVRKNIYTQARKEAEQVLADLSQPLMSPHNTTPQRATPFSSDPAAKKSTGVVSNGHASQFGKHGSVISYSPRSHTPSTSASGTRTLPPRSSTSMGLTTPPVSSHVLAPSPPIPPRSMVSLAGQSKPTAHMPRSHTSTLMHKNQSRSATHLISQPLSQPLTTPTSSKSGFNKSVSSSSVTHHHQHQPIRSTSSFGVHSSAPHHGPYAGQHPSLTRHQRLNHMEGASGQSSTVFIHHLKEGRVGGGHLV